MSRILPILFNTDMVQAILDGRKTVTKRIAKGVYPYSEYGDFTTMIKGEWIGPISEENIIKLKSPYQPGDILYVRETWGEWTDGYVYKAWTEPFPQAGCYPNTKWRPSIHMPKDAARIWLKVTDVRVERLQNMKTNDFLSEGVEVRPEAFNDPENAYGQAREIFKDIWNSTIKESELGSYGWDANPWVWAILFERCEKPEEHTDDNN